MRRVAFLILCVAMTTAYADKGGRGHGRGHDDDDRDDDRGRVAKNGHHAVAFRSEDRHAIYDYYRASPSNLPPGLAKRNGNLPPGLQKQLYRNGRLPPGLEKRIAPFPPELDRRFPPLPPGYYRGFIGDQAIIYDPKRQLIVDALNIAMYETTRPR